MAISDLEKIIDVMRHGVIVQAVDGRVLHANRAAAAALGVTLEQIYCHTFLDENKKVVREDGTPFPVANRPCAQTLVSGAAQRDVVLGVYGDDGELRWLNVSSEPLYEDDGTALKGALVTIYDITEQRCAKRALQASEADFRALFDNLIDVYYRADAKGRFSLLSPSVFELLGYRPEELLGKPASEHYVDPQGRTNFIEALNGAEGQLRGYEAALYHKNGSQVWVSSSARYRYDSKGNICCIEGTIRDISERKRVEQELCDKQQRLMVAETLSKLGSWEWNLSDNTLKWSDQTYCNLGYRPGEVEPDFELYINSVHPEDRERVLSIFSDVSASGNRFSFIYRCQHPDGTIHHLLSVGEVEHDHNGRPLRIYGTGQDITERFEAEQALQQSEAQFRAVVEQSPVPMVITDPAGNIEHFNRKFVELFGWTTDDIYTPVEWWQSIYPEPDYRRQVQEAWQKAVTEASATGSEIAPQQWKLTCKDGLQREVEVRMVPVAERRQVIAMHDITDRLHAEHALRESEQLFRAFFLHAPYGAVLSNNRGEILQSNLAIQKMFGFSEQEFLALQFRDFTVEEDIAVNQQLFNELLAGKRNGYQMEKRYRRKDGSIFRGYLAVSAVRDGVGEVKTIFSMVQDITERIESQREQNLLQRQLQQAQKMEAIGQLTGGIAHDFNNILASVIGYSELALEHLLPPGHNKLENALMEINRGGKRAAHLVAQMLDFSRGQTLTPEPTNISVVLNELLEMASATIPSSITIQTRVKPELPLVMANPVQLHQVLLNIIINARDAMEGKGDLDISVDKCTQHATCSSCYETFSGDYIEISIRDSAGAMNAEVLSRAFEPFFTTKDIGRGSGMGLSMVHGILHEWGGHIVVSLMPGESSTFHLYIPIAAPSAALQNDTVVSTGNQNGAFRNGGRARVPRILLVDDEEAIGGIIEEMLKLQGYEVEYYNDSRKALNAFSGKAASYDLLITDQTMPHLTGVELIAAIHAIRAELPVILCSGFSEKVNQDNAATYGIDTYLAKPLQSEEMFQAVTRLLK